MSSMSSPNRTPSDRDLESGYTNTVVISPGQTSVKLYQKLMECLDNVEKIDWKRPVLFCVTELLLFSGPMATLLWGNYIMSIALAIPYAISLIRHLLLLFPFMADFRVNKYTIYFVRQLQTPIMLMIWMCCFIGGWYVLLAHTKPLARSNLLFYLDFYANILSDSVNRFLLALGLSSLFWVMKTYFYLMLKASLHYDRLFDRIQLSAVYLHCLRMIHTRGKWRFLLDDKTKKKIEEEVVGEDQITGVNLCREITRMEKASVPLWILCRLEEEYLYHVKVCPLPGNEDNIENDEEVIEEAKKMFEKLIAHRISNATADISPYLLQENDLRECGLSESEFGYIFKPAVKEEENGNRSRLSGERTMTRDEFIEWAVGAYKTCLGLKLVLHNSRRMLIKLNRLLNMLLIIIVISMCILLGRAVIPTQLITLLAPFLAVIYVIADSANKMFDGLVFALWMRCFEIGDRVMINNEEMLVTGQNILTSKFYSYDTKLSSQQSNSTLLAARIAKADISGDEIGKVEFEVETNTPAEDIKDLQITIKKWLDDDIEYFDNDVLFYEIVNESTKIVVHFKYVRSYDPTKTKSAHNLKIFNMICEYKSCMKLNRKCYPPSYRPYIVEVSLNQKINLNEVKNLRTDIFRTLEKPYVLYSKVVLVDITTLRVKMALYVCDSKFPVGEESDKEDGFGFQNLNKIHTSLGRNRVVQQVQIYRKNAVYVSTQVSIENPETEIQEVH